MWRLEDIRGVRTYNWHWYSPLHIMRDTLILSDIRYLQMLQQHTEVCFKSPTPGTGLGGHHPITLLQCFSKFQLCIFPLIKGFNQAKQIWLNQTPCACRVNDKLSFMIILTGYWFFLPQFYEDNYRCSSSVHWKTENLFIFFVLLQNYRPQEHKLEVISAV